MNAAIYAAWAAAIAAAVGPVVSVALAYWMGRQENTRLEASKLFRAIMEHSQAYGDAFSDFYHFRQHLEAKKREITHYRNSRSLPVAAGDGNDQRIPQLSNELMVLDERYHRSFSGIRSVAALLNADVLSLGLLFDKKSESCGRAIRELIALGGLVDSENVPPFQDCQSSVNELIARISNAMEPLHNSLRCRFGGWMMGR